MAASGIEVIIKQPWGTYHRFIWDKVPSLLISLSEDKRVLALTFQQSQETMALATQDMYAAHHIYYLKYVYSAFILKRTQE